MLSIHRHPQLCPQLAETLTQDIAEIFEFGHTLSTGTSQIVKQCTVHGRDLIIKRYTATGPFAALRLFFGASRADNASRAASHLQKYKINVPNHLLVIKFIGFLNSETYLVMDKAEGTWLYDFMQPNSTLSLDPDAIHNIAQLIISMH